MKIVNRDAFLALPPGTLFSKYEPCHFDDLKIKGASYPNDFIYQSLNDNIAAQDSDEYQDRLIKAEETGESVAMDFDSSARDGLFDETQLFAVWEVGDARSLIWRLMTALKEGYGVNFYNGVSFP